MLWPVLIAAELVRLCKLVWSAFTLLLLSSMETGVGGDGEEGTTTAAVGATEGVLVAEGDGSEAASRLGEGV